MPENSGNQHIPVILLDEENQGQIPRKEDDIPEVRLETNDPNPSIPHIIEESLPPKDDRKEPIIQEEIVSQDSKPEGELKIGSVRRGAEGDFIRFEFAGARKAFYFPPSFKNDEKIKNLEEEFLKLNKEKGLSESDISEKQETLLLKYLEENSGKNGIGEVAVAVKGEENKWNIMTNGNIEVDVYASSAEKQESLNKVASIEGTKVTNQDDNYVQSVCAFGWGGANAVLANYKSAVQYGREVYDSNKDPSGSLMIQGMALAYDLHYQKKDSNLDVGIFYKNPIDVSIKLYSKSEEEANINNISFIDDLTKNGNDDKNIKDIINKIKRRDYVNSARSTNEEREADTNDTVITSHTLGAVYEVKDGFYIKSLTKGGKADRLGLKEGDMFEVMCGEKAAYLEFRKDGKTGLDEFISQNGGKCSVFIFNNEEKKFKGIGQITNGKDDSDVSENKEQADNFDMSKNQDKEAPSSGGSFMNFLNRSSAKESKSNRGR